MAFIGLDRGIRGHWIYQDAEYFKVWFEILWLARFSREPHNELIDGEIVIVNYGEFIFGRIKWCERLKISEQRMKTLIMKLKKEKMIEIVNRHRKCTVYKVVNYEKFNQQSNQQSDQYQQGLGGYANQQSNQPVTISQPSVNQQLTTKEQGSNKENKVNNEKNFINIVFSHWNSINLMKHRTISVHIKNQITWKLREYSVDDLVQCISNYSEILNSSEYSLETRWSLDGFFEKNHFEKFLSERDPFNFYPKVGGFATPSKQTKFDKNKDLLLKGRDSYDGGSSEIHSVQGIGSLPEPN